jgi:creatinine amidohydrolase
MAQEAGKRLSQAGFEVVRLPSVVYTPIPFAENFPGSLGIRPETLRNLLEDLHAGLSRSGLDFLLLANAHFDPANVSVLREFARAFEKQPPAVLFPDLTRRRHAERLGEEFRSGACHAGCYETSLLLAIRPELVNLELARQLPDHPVSLVDAMRQGQRSFEQAGGRLAYFGFPAKSSRQEGERLLSELGTILLEEVLERVEAVRGGKP